MLLSLFQSKAARNAAKRTAAALAALAAAQAATAANAAVLFNNWNTAGVANTTRSAVSFQIPCAAHITQIATYHWNGGRGSRPGSLLVSAGGRQYRFGVSGGNNNADWVANVSLDVSAGWMVVADSDPSTWSANAQSNGNGFVRVDGYCTSRSLQLPAPRPMPQPQPQPQPVGGYIPLPNGQFCTHPVVANAFADTFPCTGLVKPSGMTVTLKLRRPIAAPLSGMVSYQALNSSGSSVNTSVATLGGAILSGGGTSVNSVYTFLAPASLCLNTGVTYLIMAPGIGPVGEFRPWCP